MRHNPYHNPPENASPPIGPPPKPSDYMGRGILFDGQTYERGNINNYAIGYQDSRGIARSKKTYPLLPDDETYMEGWFSGLLSELEDAEDDALLEIKKEFRVRRDEINLQWTKKCRENNWLKAKEPPL